MVTPRNGLVLLLYSTVSPSLYDGPFNLGVPYQACTETPLPEVHPPGDPRPDLLGPADAQRLCNNDVVDYEGPLGVPTPVKNPLPFRCQY